MSKRPAEDIGGPSKLARGENGVAEDGHGRATKMRRDKLPVIVYRDTEPLPTLQERWREGGGEEVELEVLIPPEFLAKDNKRVKSRQIWGDLVYTPDSDLVAVLMHMGLYTSTLAHAPPAVVEARAVIKLVPSLQAYASKQRYVKSRAWNRPIDGCAYTVSRFWLVTRSGCVVELSASVDELPAPYPTVQPQSSDRYITTRNTGAKGKQSQDVSVQFNLANEPWLKYTLAAVADKGLKPSQLTSAKMFDHVLFLETATHRYQIARVGPAAGGGAASSSAEDGQGVRDLYSFSRCKMALPATAMQRQGVPLPAAVVEVLEAGLEWEEFKWGVTQLHVRGKEYPLKRIHLMRMSKPEGTATAAPTAAATPVPAA